MAHGSVIFLWRDAGSAGEPGAYAFKYSRFTGIASAFRRSIFWARAPRGFFFFFIFLLLFSSADLVFEKYITNLVSIEISEETVARIILIFVVFLIFTGAYSYVFREREKNAEVQNGKSAGALGKIESYILFGSVNVLFLLFIIIQVTYFFGGESNIILAGFTYDEYARRGFFELIAVALISLAILLLADKFSSGENGGHSSAFKFLSSALI